MKPAPFEYHVPKTIEDALALMATLENAKALAGGQSLVPMMNFRFVMPDHLVDLGNVEGLSGIHDDGATIRFGATTTQRAVEFSDLISKRVPLLQAALAHVGHRQTRNRGTIGGSLAHADPAAETPAVLSALDARLKIAGPRGTRTVAMADFNQGFMTTAVGFDELLIEIEIEPWAAHHGYSFQEFARRHGDFAVVGVAVLVELGGDGTISRAALSVCGAGTGPERLREAEASLAGKSPEDALSLVSAAAGKVNVIEDTHASAGYRRHLARTLTGRALTEAIERAREKSGGAGR